jgi:aconitate hydratase
MWRENDGADLVFTDTLELDLGDVVPSMAGPKRPQGRIALGNIATGLRYRSRRLNARKRARDFEVEGANYDIGHGDVAIAAITSCTNTSNPSVLIAAGLVAVTPLPRA